MRLLNLLLILLLLSGCGAVRSVLVERDAPEKAAKAVDTYGTSLPYAERKLYRKSINDLTEYCDIEVTCVSDPVDE